MLPIYGNSSLGYYYVQALVGSSQQPQSLIVDTGSYSTIFVCDGCSTCNRHQDPTFAPANSTTFERLTSDVERLGWSCKGENAGLLGKNCSFEQSYLEGSTYAGFYALDQFLFENETTVKSNNASYRHIFGCAMKETNEFFKQEVNGIIGLGMRKLSVYSPPTIVENTYEEGRSRMQAFSICLGHNGGRLRFGQPSVDLHLPGAIKQTILPSKLRWSDIYTVSLSGIQVNDFALHYDFEAFGQNPGQVFFDTGTTFTYFSDELYGKWKDAITLFCALAPANCAGANEYENCFDFAATNLTAADAIRTFPNTTFTFNGNVEYTWYAQDYFVRNDDTYCIGVKPLKDVILGANFMRNYDIFIDQGTQRISFVRANCSGEAGIWMDENGFSKSWLLKSARVLPLLSLLALASLF